MQPLMRTEMQSVKSQAHQTRAVPAAPPHNASAEALQRWLWQRVAAGWNPSGGDSSRWSHDDNMKVQHLGWMIASPPGSPHFDLFSLRPGTKASVLMRSIVNSAQIDPICAKAVAVLGAQRVLHPDVKFAFME